MGEDAQGMLQEVARVPGKGPEPHAQDSGGKEMGPPKDRARSSGRTAQEKEARVDDGRVAALQMVMDKEEKIKR